MTPRPRRVLLVEDEQDLAMLMSEALADAGFSVVNAANGDAAMPLFEDAEPFDVLVTDITMPGSFDGYEVGAVARSRYPGIPIVYVTGRSEATAGVGIFRTSESHLRKPFTLRDLVASVDQVLRK